MCLCSRSCAIPQERINRTETWETQTPWDGVGDEDVVLVCVCARAGHVHDTLQEQLPQGAQGIGALVAAFVRRRQGISMTRTSSEGVSLVHDCSWSPQIVEDLESLFNAFDEDGSGELDEDEVSQLVAQLGTKLSPEENHNLFRIMDADGETFVILSRCVSQ